MGDSNAPLKRFYIRGFGRLYVLPSFYRGWLLLLLMPLLLLLLVADEMSR